MRDGKHERSACDGSADSARSMGSVPTPCSFIPPQRVDGLREATIRQLHGPVEGFGGADMGNVVINPPFSRPGMPISSGEDTNGFAHAK